ncbi:soma ferritin-like [Xenia sp. Carnegie-2017]|uniref:soma ferritin-like n=1 Tax=Xenia sp. Carnegie-2017 TaxID=2897299 RepID=UPI001F0383F1|nr:soma ferritin-like [Xenia sp. Carnegie-2017]XP_046853651.1 soma ferritin-like [Xenia sp. Carnegie-2017]XP_046853652.1 soma ferritin-like [Xenia sp. Carnegie-2017]
MFSRLLLFSCITLPLISAVDDKCFPRDLTSITASKTWKHTGDKGHGPQFASTLEEGINKQINFELSAHYTYLSLSYHFDSYKIYMPGFSKFFKKMAEEEHEHAQMFMKYQNKRGGKIRLNSIPAPCHDGSWGNGTHAMKRALHLEKTIYDMLLKLHKLQDAQESDPQFQDFIESNFLGEQVDSIKQLANYVHILQRLDSSLGEYEFDKWTLGGGKDSIS